MKNLKRISLATLVLVVVLSAVLAIPASAQIEPVYDYDYDVTKQNKCTCDQGDFEVLFTSQTSSYGNTISTSTKLTHSQNACTSIFTSHTSTTWYYPNSTSSAYNTLTNYASDGLHQSSNGTKYSHASTNREATGTQILFCVETSHTATTTCTPCGQKTYTGYTCAGEPALK